MKRRTELVLFIVGLIFMTLLVSSCDEEICTLISEQFGWDCAAK